MKIAVLGAGLVGRIIAEDLSKRFAVSAIDINTASLDFVQNRNHNVNTIVFDLQNHSGYQQLLAPFDLVVVAVPGFMGYQTLEAVINAGKTCVDISFSPENTFDLNELAKEKNVTVIVDCGVAPGMGNLILGRYNEEMLVENFECYVGGLPKERKKPFEYKAPFSPADVIEEYMRPARLKENGIIVTRDALTEIELLEFNEIGTLEAFNTDGLRSLLFTMEHIPNLKEKTLRYPGHAELIIGLKRSGFFSTDPVIVEGKSLSPLSFSTAILFKEWQLEPAEEEFTVMKVLVEGIKEGQPFSVDYSLLDRYDTVTKTTSMARSTGYTCAAAVHLIAENLFYSKGVFPPELVGSDKACFDFVLNYLSERNVNWKKRTE